MTNLDTPQLLLEFEIDEQMGNEIEQKGYFEHSYALLPDGSKVRVCFWDPVRLAQDLETEQRLGRPCIGEPGIVIVPKVTCESMQMAIEYLYRTKYFERLASLIHRGPPEKVS
jgi:hypothetical protein